MKAAIRRTRSDVNARRIRSYLLRKWAGLHVGRLAGGGGLLLWRAEVGRLTRLTVPAHVLLLLLLLLSVLRTHLRRHQHQRSIITSMFPAHTHTSMLIMIKHLKRYTFNNNNRLNRSSFIYLYVQKQKIHLLINCLVFWRIVGVVVLG